jgi:hypothetical protein
MAFSATVSSAYAACLKAIPTMRRLDDIKEFRDVATGLVQAARHRKNLVAERQCVEIRLRCERRWGELYRVSDKAKGTRGQLVSRGVIGAREERAPTTPTLADMGVSYTQSPIGRRWPIFRMMNLNWRSRVACIAAKEPTGLTMLAPRFAAKC